MPRLLLPGLLLTALTASGASLWVLDTAREPVPAPAPARLVPLAEAQPVQDPLTVVARASRGRREDIAALERRRAAAAAGARKARAAEAERRRNATACPVPSASFTDTWGAGRSGGRAHQGTDMLADHGDPVYAVRSGVVTTDHSGNGGISLYLTDDDGDRYFYAHNAANLVTSGDRVEAGELIARVGDTGNARGGPSHVHFELQRGGGEAVPSYAFLREIC